MKSLSQIRQSVITEASGDKEAYQAFFRKALKKFGVTEPDQLKGDKEKEFYDYIDAGWEGDNEKPEPGDKKEAVNESCGLDHSTMTGTCPECGKQLSEDTIEENLKGIAKALTSMSGKPEYKKIMRNLKSLAMRAGENDKGAAKQIKTQLVKLSAKVGKKEAKKLMKMADLASTYEEVEESVSVDMRTRGFKSAVKRNLLRKEKATAKKKSEIDEIIDATNKKLRGESMVASGSDATGDVAGKDMPLLKKKKVLKKFKDA